MKWREAVKLAVAKRLYTAVANRSGREPEWGGPACDTNFWLQAADGAIKAVRSGCEDVGVHVSFEMSDRTFRQQYQEEED